MITFELPFHTMCSTHIGILYSNQYKESRSVDFDFIGLSELPEVIILEGKDEEGMEGRFRYKGISDGQAIYSREDEKGENK